MVKDMIPIHNLIRSLGIIGLYLSLSAIGAASTNHNVAVPWDIFRALKIKLDFLLLAELQSA
jgi:hypothetical protein